MVTVKVAACQLPSTPLARTFHTHNPGLKEWDDLEMRRRPEEQLIREEYARIRRRKRSVNARVAPKIGFHPEPLKMRAGVLHFRQVEEGKYPWYIQACGMPPVQDSPNKSLDRSVLLPGVRRGVLVPYTVIITGGHEAPAGAFTGAVHTKALRLTHVGNVLPDVCEKLGRLTLP